MEAQEDIERIDNFPTIFLPIGLLGPFSFTINHCVCVFVLVVSSLKAVIEMIKVSFDLHFV